jgi:hypothetical protein
LIIKIGGGQIERAVKMTDWASRPQSTIMVSEFNVNFAIKKLAIQANISTIN